MSKISSLITNIFNKWLLSKKSLTKCIFILNGLRKSNLKINFEGLNAYRFIVTALNNKVKLNKWQKESVGSVFEFIDNKCVQVCFPLVVKNYIPSFQTDTDILYPLLHGTTINRYYSLVDKCWKNCTKSIPDLSESLIEIRGTKWSEIGKLLTDEFEDKSRSYIYNIYHNSIHVMGNNNVTLYASNNADCVLEMFIEPLKSNAKELMEIDSFNENFIGFLSVNANGKVFSFKSEYYKFIEANFYNKEKCHFYTKDYLIKMLYAHGVYNCYTDTACNEIRDELVRVAQDSNLDQNKKKYFMANPEREYESYEEMVSYGVLPSIYLNYDGSVTVEEYIKNIFYSN